MRTRMAFLEYVLDQLSGMENLLSRPMFGGIGLYAGTVFFGIIYHDTLYLKVDDRTRADYERAGMKPFTPYAPRTTTMQYYEVPRGVLENGEDLTAYGGHSNGAGAAVSDSHLQFERRDFGVDSFGVRP